MLRKCWKCGDPKLIDPYTLLVYFAPNINDAHSLGRLFPAVVIDFVEHFLARASSAAYR